MRIRRIEVCGFRGVWPSKKPVELDCGPGGKSVVLFAENALGKSTFAEAVEFVVARRLRKEDYWGEEFTPAHRVNAFLADCDDVDTAEVRITFVSGDTSCVCSVRLGEDGAIVDQSYEGGAEETLRGMDVGTCVLDYETFTRFVNETLRRRGDRFSQLLGLEQTALFRDGLEALRRRGEQDLGVDDDRTRLSHVDRELADVNTELTASAGALGLEVQEVSNSKLREILKGCLSSQLLEAHLNDADLLGGLVGVPWEEFRESLRVPERVRGAILEVQALDEQIAAAEQVPAEEVDVLAGLTRQRQQLLRQERQFWREPLDRLYETGLEIVGAPTPPQEVPKDVCPLCEQPKQWEELREELMRRREQFAAIRSAWGDLQRDWEAARDRLLPHVHSWHKVFSREELQPLRDAIECIDQDISSLQSVPKLEFGAVGERLKALNEEAPLRRGHAQNRKDAIDVSDPTAVHRKRLEDVRTVAEAYPAKMALEEAARGLTGMIDDKVAWCDALRSEAERFGTEERELNATLMQHINEVGDGGPEGLIQRYYKVLHPRDDIVPFVEPVGEVERSVRLRCRFKGKDNLSAVGVLSDSHRASFGLAIFLAAVRFRCERGEQGFVVLDDVTYGLDPGHRGSLLRLLDEEFADIQIVLLTHDELLYKMGQQMLDHERFSFLRIPYWHSRGVPLVQEQTDLYAKAREFAAHGEKECAALYARLGFEGALKRVCSTHRIPVAFARRPQDYSVETLLSSLRKHVNDLKAKGRSVVDLEDYERRVKCGKLLANLSVHYSDFLAHPLVTADIHGVIEAFEEFERLFKCRCCRTWLHSIETGWECRGCGTRH